MSADPHLTEGGKLEAAMAAGFQAVLMKLENLQGKNDSLHREMAGLRNELTEQREQIGLLTDQCGGLAQVQVF